MNINKQFYEIIYQRIFLRKHLIFFMILIFILFVNCWLILRSNLSHYKKVRYAEMALKKEFEKKYQSSNLDAYRMQMVSVIKEYEKEKRKLIKNDETSSLLNKITRFGMDSGIDLEFFSPKRENKKNFFNKLIIHIIVLGDYHKLMFFLSKLLEFDKLIVFENFEIYKNKSTRTLKMKIKAAVQIIK